ncbi:NDP-sugar synthase [Bacteroidota bacterium]
MQSKFKNINKLSIVILCGGKGERLYPYTNDIPKPLLEIKNKPILSYIIEHLARFEMQELIFATGYKSDKIKHFIDSKYSGCDYKTIDSGNVDIIKRIQDASQYIQNDFMILYGDTLSNVNYNKLLEFHKSNKQPATMTVWPLQSQFGVVDIAEDGKVLNFHEKPILDKWINIGYFCFRKEMIEDLFKHSSYATWIKTLAAKEMLNAYKHKGIHITVNTIKELADAEKNVDKI